MRKILARLLIFCLFAAALFLAIDQPPKSYYPEIEIETNDPSGNLNISIQVDARASSSECDAITGNIARAAIKACPQCRISKLGCETELDETRRILFTDAPLPTPSGRMADGVITFNATNPEMALTACQTSEARSAGSSSPVKCYAADMPRTKPQAPTIATPLHALLLLAAFAASWLAAWFIIRYEHLHAHLSHDHVASGPQKYHTQPTPRIGGLVIFIGLIASGSFMLFESALISEHAFGLLLLAGLPAFLGGLTEDLTKKVGVLERLLLTILSGAIAAWLLGATLTRLGIPIIDPALTWLPFAVFLTAFAVGGIANAINIIDGYNGLASGFAVIVLAAMAYVAHTVGDRLVFSTALSLTGALLGFMVWNWPAGKIFLGDGGAYLLGFLLAELSVLIVIRNPQVSPWFPLLLLIYPIFETLYSIYRRKLKHKLSPGQPDNRHLHQLVHDYLIPHGVGNGKHYSRNSRVAKYFWIPSATLAILGVSFRDATPLLVACAIGYCLFYIVTYRRIESRPPIDTTSRHYEES